MSSARSDPDQETNNQLEQGSVSSQHSPSSPDRPRRSRIHFPSELDHATSSKEAPSSRHASQSKDYHGLSVASTSTNILEKDEPAARRRVPSTNSDRSAAYSRTQFVAGPSNSRTHSRRAVSHSMNGHSKTERGTASLGSSPLSRRSMLASEGEGEGEYDPSILADLHKALQHKAEVEQKLREARTQPHPIPTHSLRSSSRTMSHPILSGSSTLGRTEPSTPVRTEFVDFSPSIGKTKSHPIPTSADDGATLDWSGTLTSDDEKRERKWSVHLTRKPSKEKYPPVSRKRELEKQTLAYSHKLSIISEKANTPTMHKVEIVKDELQRRYSVLDPPSASGSGQVNSLDVARWISQQSASVKALFCDVNTRPWLRHLTQKDHTRRQLSPWFLSAAIVDEYVRSKTAAGIMQFSPRSQSSIANGSDVDGDSHLSITDGQAPRSRPTSFHSVDITSIRRRSEDHVSFGPAIHSRRDSAGADSRYSAEVQPRGWRHSFTGRTNESSAQSSVKGRQRKESVELPSSRASPVSTRSPLQNFGGIRKRTRLASRNSEEGQSSNVDSVEEHEPEGKKQDQDRKRSRFHLSLDIRGPHGSADDLRESPITIDDFRTDARRPRPLNPPDPPSLPPPPQTGQTGTSAGASTGTSKDVFSDSPSPPPSKIGLGSPIVLSSARRPTEKRSVPILSLPLSFQTPNKRAREDRSSEVYDHALHVEYTRKRETLDELLMQNVRIKSLMNGAYKTIIEYDETQQAMAERINQPYTPIPPEVLKALSQDPYHAPGDARHLKGWEGVEAICNHRKNHRSTLETFVASISETIQPLFVPDSSIYDDEMESLSQLIKRLRTQRKDACARAKETNDLLSKVKVLRDELKPDYEEASMLTSANYPELVRLETLLDEFINRRNRLWKLGEASLSFILTSVAPLMKTFGRPIWDELHAFLVIPFYRNSFSGEEDWYPVSFPHRTFMQWLRLLMFAVGIPFLLFHGTHFFVELLTGGYVLRIPSYIPSFIIYLLFSGAMSTYASFLLSLLAIVVCECVIVLWWTAWTLRIVK